MLTVPVAAVAPGERAQERRLAVADHAGDADDLAAAGGERDVGEAVSAQPLDPQQRLVVRVGRRASAGRSPRACAR